MSVLSFALEVMSRSRLHDATSGMVRQAAAQHASERSPAKLMYKSHLPELAMAS